MTSLLCGEMKFKNRRELTYGLLILCIGFIGGLLWGRQQSLTISPEAAVTEAEGLESKTSATSSNKSPIEAIKNSTIQRAHESETHKNAPKQSSELVGDIETIGNDYILRRQEENFQTSIRSCLGSECFDQKVKLYSGKEVTRIGILALEHSGGQPLFDLLQGLHGGKDLAKFDLVYENHAPAYGYGKNHGWSSIIRLARRPIPHSYSLARAVSSSEVSVSLLSTQVRQMVRWHCRLSHVAAHTRMLTVFVEDILSRPIVEMEKIITFIGIKLDRPKMVAAIDDFRVHLTRDLGPRAPDDLPRTLLEGAVAALEDELTSTKGLTQWPCKMFRDLEPEKSGVRLLMPASQVAANCTGLYVTCSVPYDQRGG